MTTTLYRVGRLLAAAALAGLLAACGGSDDPAATAPTITTPPAALAVTEGQRASFAVVADGSAPLAYEWRRNGSTIAGASAASYTLAAATLADNDAAFSVVVSNSVGSVASAAAVLSVNPLAVMPTITAQPAAVVLTAGGNASFSAAASGTPAPTLRWFIDGGADLADGAGSGPLAGATVAGAGTTTLTLSAVPQAANGLQLRLRASNSAGTAESSAAALTVNAATVAPSITSQPAAVTLTAGGNASFTVAASGMPMPTVQWLIAGGANLSDGPGTGALTGATIAGAGGATLTLSNVPQIANGLLLAARAGNTAGAATSDSAALTVNPAGVAISAAAGGTVRGPVDAVTIEIPPGALSADATFTLTPATTIADFAPEFREVPGALWNLSISGGQLLPGRMALVRFGVDPNALPAGSARALRGPVRRASAPAGGDGSGWVVVRCEAGEPRTVVGERGSNDWTAPVIFCESGGDRTAALGLVVNRASVPGTTAYDIALDTVLSRMRSWDWVGVDRFGQVTLSICVGVASPTDPSQTVCANNLARIAANGNVAANARVSGGNPGSANLELWPTMQPWALAGNGAIAGLWRGGVAGQRRARVEAYGVAPFGSGRLLTQQRFAPVFGVDVAANTNVPVRGINFAPSNEMAVHEFNRFNLYNNGNSTPRLSEFFGINFPGRPAGSGDGAGSYSGAPALDTLGNAYKAGLNSVDDTVTGFCSPGCPAVYKYGPAGQPLWFRVLGQGGGLFGPTVAIDPQGRPVVRYSNAQNRDVVVRLDATTGAITASIDVGPTVVSGGTRNTLTFDDAGNTYAALGRYLVRIPPDFDAASAVGLEFGLGQTGDHQAIGADSAGNAYGIFSRGANTANPEFRLFKARYP